MVRRERLLLPNRVVGWEPKTTVSLSVFVQKLSNVYQPAVAGSEPIQSKHITGQRRDNSPPFSLFFIVWAIFPLSQLARGKLREGGGGGGYVHTEKDSFLLQEPTPPAPGEQDRRRWTESRTWRWLFISSLLEEARGEGGGRGRGQWG